MKFNLQRVFFHVSAADGASAAAARRFFSSPFYCVTAKATRQIVFVSIHRTECAPFFERVESPGNVHGILRKCFQRNKSTVGPPYGVVLDERWVIITEMLIAVVFAGRQIKFPLFGGR